MLLRSSYDREKYTKCEIFAIFARVLYFAHFLLLLCIGDSITIILSGLCWKGNELVNTW